jgi:hypothetical protein
MAGLPVLEKKDGDADADDAEAAPAEGEEAEDDIPAIIKKIAKKAEGKSGEDLEGLLQKVYDAGFKDGVASTKEEKEEAVEEGKKHKAKPVEDEACEDDAPKKDKKADKEEKEEVPPFVKK